MTGRQLQMFRYYKLCYVLRYGVYCVNNTFCLIRNGNDVIEGTGIHGIAILAVPDKGGWIRHPPERHNHRRKAPRGQIQGRAAAQ